MGYKLSRNIEKGRQLRNTSPPRDQVSFSIFPFKVHSHQPIWRPRCTKTTKKRITLVQENILAKDCCHGFPKPHGGRKRHRHNGSHCPDGDVVLVIGQTQRKTEGSLTHTIALLRCSMRCSDQSSERGSSWRRPALQRSPCLRTMPSRWRPYSTSSTAATMRLRNSSVSGSYLGRYRVR